MPCARHWRPGGSGELRNARFPRVLAPSRVVRPAPSFHSARAVRARVPLAELLRFLLPARCLGCASPLPMDAPTIEQRTLICPICLARLREPPWPRCDRCHFPRGTGRVASTGCLECAAWPAGLTCARASAVLEPPADALVHALKYGGWSGLARPIGARMARLCPPPAGDVVVVPVPTTPVRARSRGYNQAELLARAYSELLSARLLDALVREREGPSQVALAPERRRKNVAGSFRVRPAAKVEVRSRSIVLVDDVLTTGATAGAAAEVLERAGALGVTVIAFARALPGRDYAA